MKEKRTFYARSAFWANGIDLGIMVVRWGGIERPSESVVRFSLEPHTEGDEVVEPTARLSKDEAQELLDVLWSVGIRPSSGDGNVGQLGATERHLEDMRKLVFK